MKKNFRKKLVLNKKTITRLQDEEMVLIRGASLIVTSCNCDTASCSIVVFCCGTDTKEQENDTELFYG